MEKKKNDQDFLHSLFLKRHEITKSFNLFGSAPAIRWEDPGTKWKNSSDCDIIN